MQNKSGHSYNGRRGRRSRRSGNFSQATYRRGITLHDQHGREWTAQVGTKTGMPTGIIQPSFSAPWYPDHQYMRVNPENTSELFIDYEALLLRRRARLTDFHNLALDIARKKGLPLPAKVGEYSDELLGLLPGMPKPVQPIVAAMQGNEYILGLTTIVDERLRRFVQPSRDALLAEAEAMDFRPRSFADAKAANTTAAARPRAEVRDVAASEAEASDAFSVDGAEHDVLEGLDAGEEGADLDGMLEALDEEFDAEAVGGRTIAPHKQERAARQAPRRGGTKVARKGTVSREAAAKQRRAAAKKAGRRPTLADGARPVISE